MSPSLQLSGAALATLSKAARRRLLATALGEAWRRRLGMRADHGALGHYLTLSKSRLVSSFPDFGIGAISRDGESLAPTELARPDRPKIESLKAYGGREAEEFLLERVREWATLREPKWNDSTVIEDDVAGAVSKLREQASGDILVNGSARLVRALTERRRADEYRLMVFPIVLRTGKRLFDEASATSLRLIDSRDGR